MDVFVEYKAHDVRRFKLPEKSIYVSIGPFEQKLEFVSAAKSLVPSPCDLVFQFCYGFSPTEHAGRNARSVGS